MPGGDAFFVIEVRGANRVANRFRRAASQGVKLYDKEMQRWAQGVRRHLKKKPYPPPRPGQRYKRTGRLASSWYARRVKAGRYEIGNRANQKGRYYARYVVGDGKGQGQAWMHRGRWWIARKEIEQQMPKLRALIAAKLVKVLEG